MNINISKRNLMMALVTFIILNICYCTVFSVLIFYRVEILEDSILGFKSSADETVSGNLHALDEEFIVAEADGKIGIFDKNSGKLLKMLDVYVATLPKADQILLYDGMTVESEYDLVMLVQDYTS